MRQRNPALWALAVVAATLAGTAVAQSTTGAQASPRLAVSVATKAGQIPAGKVTDHALEILVTLDGTPLANASVSAELVTGDSAAISFAGGAGVGADGTVTGKTDTSGTFLLSVDATKVPLGTKDAVGVVKVSAETTVGSTKLEATAKAVVRVHSGYRAFVSDRLATELFLGSTFATKYDATGKADGFGETDFLARLSFDTLWGHGKPWRFHTGVQLQMSGYPETKAAEEKPASALAGPSDVTVELADSFAGYLNAHYQPAWAAVFSPGTNHDPDKPNDVLRFGIFARVGFVTVQDRTIEEDAQLRNYRLGLSFTHHNTAASSLEAERANVYPNRFVECSYAWFEEIFGREGDKRLVCDAGLRLLTIAEGNLPFYAGVYVNSGGGPDDLRIFAGFLFQLEELTRVLGAGG